MYVSLSLYTYIYIYIYSVQDYDGYHGPVNLNTMR